LSDDLFVWPTHAGLFALRTRDGMPARQPIPGPHGNLAFADGVLLCATPTELWGYVSPSQARPGVMSTGSGKRWANHLDDPPPSPDELLSDYRAELVAPVSAPPQASRDTRP
jgi:hypothetical protein